MFYYWFDMFAWWSVIGYVGFALTFIFSDSFYYMFRHWLDKDVYPSGFKAVSKNSTAWFDLTFGTPDYKTRLAALFVGLFLMFGMFGGMFS